MYSLQNKKRISVNKQIYRWRCVSVTANSVSQVVEVEHV